MKSIKTGFIFLYLFGSISLLANHCLEFDGSNDYVILTDLNLDGNFTIEAWIYLDNYTDNYRSIISKHTQDGSGNDNCEFNLQVQKGSGNLNYFMGNGSSPGDYGVILNGNNDIDDLDIDINDWYHVAITIEGSTCKMYLDGTLTDQDTFSGTRQTGDLPIQIGRYNNGTGGTVQFWDGKIDEIRIWNIVRTQTQIQNNMDNELNGNEPGLLAYYKMNEGSGTSLTDNSVNSNTGTINGASWVVSDAPSPISLISFDPIYNAGRVELRWITESETNNARFLIYRDHDIIASVRGNGTTSEPHTYEYLDDQIIPGNTYTYMLADVSYANKETKYTEKTVTVTIPQNDISQKFTLNINYPNPFNPTTEISYSISTEASLEEQLPVINLSIFDMNGKKIATLVNDIKSAGYYSVKWDASHVSSGIYFYRLQAGDFVDTKKMVFMK